MIRFKCPQCSNEVIVYTYDEDGYADIPEAGRVEVDAFCATAHLKPVRMVAQPSNTSGK